MHGVAKHSRHPHVTQVLTEVGRADATLRVSNGVGYDNFEGNNVRL